MQCADLLVLFCILLYAADALRNLLQRFLEVLIPGLELCERVRGWRLGGSCAIVLRRDTHRPVSWMAPRAAVTSLVMMTLR